MLRVRDLLMVGAVMPLCALTACGGGDGTPVASTPTPPPAPAPTPPPPPPPPPPPSSVNYNTAEYARSNAAVQAKALSAYQAGATGAGITVGVIDSGVNANSAEFTGRISAQSADLAGTRSIQDPGGHGTAVSDVLLGAKNDTGIHGVALGATLLVLRTDTPGSCAAPAMGTDKGGCTHDDTAIARGVDLAVTAGARVVNISLGGSPAANVLRQAINRATAAGVIIVISAGNDGVDNPSAAVNPDPLAQIAIDPVARGLVLIAGATDTTQTLADFSNKAGNSAAVYLTALGVRVRAEDQTGAAFLWTGTSFSAPVVAGSIALLAQAFPTLTSAQIVDLLLRTTTDLGAPGVDAIYGHGELNLQKAFAPQGGTSLAGSAVPVSLTDNANLSPAMGDAARGRLSASVRDGYGRDYGVDLAGTIRGAPRASLLGGALGLMTHSGAAASGPVTLALSVSGSGTTAQPLLLSGRDAEGARALAASASTRVGAHMQVAIGFAQSGDGLARGLAGLSEPAFLVSRAASGSPGFELAARGAFAARRSLGEIGLTLAAESGDVRLWQSGTTGPIGDGYRRFSYDDVSLALDAARGPVSLTARITHMAERDTVLGARFSAALGGGGASSWLADTGAALRLGEHTALGAAWRRGWTQVTGGPVRGASMLTTQALSFDATRRAVLNRNDSIALRWSEPLRVISGALDLTGLGGDRVLLGLTPLGHERDMEAVYATRLGTGRVTINSYWRQQPGNYVGAPDDLGAAIRYAFGF